MYKSINVGLLTTYEVALVLVKWVVGESSNNFCNDIDIFGHLRTAQHLSI